MKKKNNSLTLLLINARLIKMFGFEQWRKRPLKPSDIEKAYTNNPLTSENAKTVKGEKKGYKTFIQYFAPSKLSSYNVCSHATKGCINSCLNTSGRGKFYMVTWARIRKTLAYMFDKKRYISNLELHIEIESLKAKHQGFIPVFRLNGTSDLNWLSTIAKFPNVQFYDYTKILGMVKKNKLPNYDLTFSKSETNDKEVKQAIKLTKVACVFRTLPDTYLGKKVIDGDNDDLRFTNKKNVIIGLHAKGKAKKDKSGFVI